jgi:hypothetical protein
LILLTMLMMLMLLMMLMMLMMLLLMLYTYDDFRFCMCQRRSDLKTIHNHHLYPPEA